MFQTCANIISVVKANIRLEIQIHLQSFHFVCVCTCFSIEVAKVVNEKCEKIHFSVQPGDKNSKQHAISNVPAHAHTLTHAKVKYHVLTI